MSTYFWVTTKTPPHLCIEQSMLSWIPSGLSGHGIAVYLIGLLVSLWPIIRWSLIDNSHHEQRFCLNRRLGPAVDRGRLSYQ